MEISKAIKSLFAIAIVIIVIVIIIIVHKFCPRITAFCTMEAAQSKEEIVEKLRALHRPLEEHWSVQGGLDPEGSDIRYKNHLARLRNIYVHHQFDVDGPPEQINMLPMSLLYGGKGLLTTGSSAVKQKQAKETGWVENFGKYSALTKEDPVVQEEVKAHEQPRTQNYNSRRAVGGGGGDTASTMEEQLTNARHGCEEDVSREELIMLGMYALDEGQKQVYKDFVQMLRGFDSHDMVCKIPWKIFLFSPLS